MIVGLQLIRPRKLQQRDGVVKLSIRIIAQKEGRRDLQIRGRVLQGGRDVREEIAWRRCWIRIEHHSLGASDGTDRLL